ncbi:Trafficking protein particle complex subunit 33 [Orbilia brochopaga]|uniref:Trafficking protein particle complex subunit 33 n=1 Tax=Orbilia brochopaga TaxID=3140254 RepID=A0AAV9UXP5_9PEZI
MSRLSATTAANMSFEAPLPPYNFTDPTATFFSASCIDLLLIELVPLVHRIADAAPTIDSPAPTSTIRSDAAATAVPAAPPAGGAAGAAAVGDKEEEDAARDDIFSRLENLGYKVGIGLVERFSRDRSRFTDTLDVIKFLCKDIWHLVFRKQIDNLKTNHRGVYVLTDLTFRPLVRMSTTSGVPATTKAAPFLQFPCGIIRGALSAMGVNAQVTAETPGLPGAVFQITTVNKNPSS